jgi:hypothetical protein
VSALAHEYGHYLQTKKFTKKQKELLDTAYDVVYNHLHGKVYDKEVLGKASDVYVLNEYDAEKRAWKILSRHGASKKLLLSHLRGANRLIVLLKAEIQLRKELPKLPKNLKVPRRILTREEVVSPVSRKRLRKIRNMKQEK